MRWVVEAEVSLDILVCFFSSSELKFLIFLWLSTKLWHFLANMTIFMTFLFLINITTFLEIRSKIMTFRGIFIYCKNHVFLWFEIQDTNFFMTIIKTKCFESNFHFLHKMTFFDEMCFLMGNGPLFYKISTCATLNFNFP